MSTQAPTTVATNASTATAVKRFVADFPVLPLQSTLAWLPAYGREGRREGGRMDGTELRALQAPLKTRYAGTPPPPSSRCAPPASSAPKT